MKMTRFLSGALLGALLAGAIPLFAASTSTDAIDSVSTSTAIKAPVRGITTTNITLSGLSSITTTEGSVTPVDGDRFLLTGQTTASENLIYVAHSTAWTVAQDSDGARDLRDGTLVVTQGGVMYHLTTADTIQPGTTSLTWVRIDNLSASGAVTGAASVATLKALTGMADGQSVDVACYYTCTTPDGGGGKFKWDSSSSASDNGGTIIAADAGGIGRWLRVYSGASLNVKWFGAKGDNSTDDATALDSAKSALSSSGGELVFPVGTYLKSTQWTFSSLKGVRLVGESASTQETGGSTLKYTGTSSPFLSISANASFAIDGLNIRYNSGSFTGTLVAAPLTAGLSILRSSLMGEGVSTALYLLSLDTATDVRVSGVEFDRSQYAILGQSVAGTGYANGVAISGSRFGSGITVGDIRDPGQGWSITGCDFEAIASGKGQAVKMSDSGVTAKALSIGGSWFGDATDNTAWSWIEFSGQGLTASGNFIHGTGALASTGIEVKETSSGVTVVGNQIDSHAKGVDLSTVSSNVLVYGNDFASTTAHLSGTPAGQAVLQNNTLALEVWAAGSRQMSVNNTTGNVILNGGITAGEGIFANNLKVTGGIFYPSTPAQAAQTAAEVYAGSGAPNNANGSNGAFYFRSDGTQAGNTVIYHKEAGSWVALITS